MSEPRPLDADKIDRLKARFEAVRAREQGQDLSRADRIQAKRTAPRERPQTPERERE